ncbi:MAG: sortase [Anaerolineales bacterium]
MKSLSSIGYKILTALMIVVLALGAMPVSPAYAATDTYSTPGTFTWTAPAGVTSVTVQAWGGGGGGGRASGNNGNKGGGGAGGQFSTSVITVVPGNSYTIVVGAGGAGGTNANGNNGLVGGDSTFNTNSVVAKGGAGGTANGAGGAGSAAGGVGTVFRGGNGSAGNGAGSGAAGGAGGGGAGTTGNGGDAAGNTAGTGTTIGGGAGGAGRTTGGVGNSGVTYGGGGGGAYRTGGNSQDGGAGAGGQVILTYVAPPTVTVVSSTSANGTYGVGAVIPVTVTFSSAVNVTGTPQLTLETGAVDRVINYLSGTGTSILTFNYTVQAGDTSADLNYVATTSFSLNGGTIRDATTLLDAILTLPAVGGANSLGGQKNIVIDTAAPTATIDLRAASDTGTSNSDNLTNAASPIFDVAFNENVSGLTNTDFSNAGGTATGCTFAVGVPAGNTYPVTVSGCSEGTLILRLATSGVSDGVGNLNAQTDGPTVTIDRTGPAVTISQQTTPPQADPTNASPINFAVVFTEAVTNFATGDVNLTASSVGGTLIGTVTGSGTTYNVAVTGMTTAGNVVASINAGVASDAAGNGNSAAPLIGDRTVTYTTPIITVDTGAGGAITPPGTAGPNVGSVSVVSGLDSTFDITPAAGFVVLNVQENQTSGNACNSPVGRVNSHTFLNVTGNRRICATFDGGWSAPQSSANSGGTNWNTIANGYVSDNQRATSNGLGLAGSVDYFNFNIPAIPASATIDGIEVSIEGFTSGPNLNVSISGNTGGSFTATQATTLGANEATAILGGPTNLWGTTWVPADFTNAEFRLRVASPGGLLTQFSLDQVQVKVHYRQSTVLNVGTASGVYGGTTTLTATLTTAGVTPTPISGQTINFFLNGNPATPIGSATTDINGNATLNNVDLSGINAGTHTGIYNTSGVGASYGGTAAGTLPGYISSTAANTLTITQAAPTVSVTGGTFVYDGNPHAATGFAYGLGGIGDILTPAVTYTYVGTGGTVYGPSAVAPTDVGTYNATANFAGNTNYSSAANTAAITITPATPTVSVTGGTFVYDGNPHAATGFAYGVGGIGDVLAPAVTFSYTGTGGTVYGPSAVEPTNVGTYDVTASFAGNLNYSAAIGTAAITITPATPTVSVTGGTFVYDGNPHAATGFAYGVGGVGDVLAPAVTFSYTGTGGTVYGPSAVEPTDVGTYAVTASFAGNLNYSAATGTATITITPATPTVSVTGGTFVYDGNPHAATGFAYGLGGIGDVLIPAVTYSYVGTGSTVYGPSAVAPTNVGTYDATANFAGNANYSSASNTAAITITPATPTVSVTGGTFVYDGTPHAATGFAYGVGGVGDVLTPAVTYSYVGTGGTVYGPSAVAPTNVGTYDATANFAGNANYSSASNIAAITITPATPTVSVTGGTFVYDGNPHAATGFAYGVGGIGNVLIPAVTFSYSGTGGTVYGPSAVAPTDVGTYDATASFAGNLNYSAAIGTATITITPATPTVSVTGGTFVYDGNPHAATGFAYGVNGVGDVLIPAVTFSYTGAGGTVYGPSAIAPVDVGTYDVTASFAGNLNYVPASGTTVITITQASATVSVTGGTFVFDGAAHGATGFAYGVGGIGNVLTPAVTFTYMGIGATSYGPTSVEPTNVGLYSVTALFAGNLNYASAIGTTTITITQAAATVSVTGGTFVYDGTSHAATGFAYGVGGIADVQAPPVNFVYNGTGATVYGPSPIAPVDVGTYDATATFFGNTNYAPASNTAAITITQAAATVSATGGTFVYDGNPHAATGFAYGINGVGDVLTPAVTFSYTGTGGTVYGPSALAPTDVGTYDVLVSFAGNLNYSPASGTTTITITSATATVSVTGGTFVYDGTPHAATGFAYGVGGTGDVLAPAVTFSYTGTGGTVYGPSAVAPTNVGTYDVTVSFAGNLNYTPASDTTTLTITPATPAISITGGTFTFDAAPHGATGFAYGVGGIADVLAPAVTFSYSGSGYGPTATPPTNVGTYTVTASFAGNANYSSTSDTATIIINPVGVTVSVTGGTFVYDGASHGATGFAYGVGGIADVQSPAVTFTYVGTGATVYPSTATPPTNAGTYSATASFAGNSNYLPASNVAAITITQRPIEITAVTDTKPYDGNTSSSGIPTITAGTLIGTDSFTLTQTFDTKDAGVGKSLIPHAVISVGNANNYAITYVNDTTGEITAIELTVSNVTANNRVYDGTTNVTLNTGTAALVGVLGTDNVTLTGTAVGAFINKNVGPLKAVIVTGYTLGGTASGNYFLTQPDYVTATITARPITVSAQQNIKVYDGTTSSAVIPSITAGSLAVGDTANFTQTYDTQNVGTSKTLTPSGAVNDGNLGGNYSVTFANNGTGVINRLPLTITAAPKAKALGAIDPPLTYTITVGSLISPDTLSGSLTRVPGEGAGTYAILQGSVSAGPNYDLTYIGANLTIAVGAQSITVVTSAPLSAPYNTNFNVAATATSSLPVTITTTGGACSGGGVNGVATITMLSGTGVCTIHYNQAGDANYTPALEVIENTNAQKADQAINVNIPAPANATYNTGFNVAATATSGLTVTYTATGICTNVGSNYTVTSGTGVCTVQYNQAGDANYNPAPQVTNTTNAQKANQTINVTTPAPAAAAYGSNFAVSANSSSGLAVVYSSVGSCTNAGPTYNMTLPTGTCTVQFNQPGDANYNAASQVTQSVNAQKANQTITVTTSAPVNATFGSTFTVAATASSGLAVTYSSVGSCTNVGADFTVTSSSGSCTVLYNQAGNANYNAAPQVSEFTNSLLTNQTITVTTPAPANAAFGSNFTVAAVATSGLPVTYSAVGSCTNVGTTFTMTSSTGTCTVQYNQAGNVNFNPAPQVTNTTNAQKANQVITVGTPAPANAVMGATFTVAATASSGLPVAYSATGACTNIGADFTITSGAGTCVVHYNQAGDVNYNAATEITAGVTAQRADQTITVTSHAPASAANGTSFNVVATSGSGLPVAITATGACMGAGTGNANITVNSNSGTCTVHYNQAGDANYNPAIEVLENATALPSAQAITIVTHAPAIATNGASFLVEATSNSGLIVAVTVSGGVCSVVDNGDGTAVVTITSATGTCTTHYNQPGDTNYAAAPELTEDTTLDSNAPTVTINQAAGQADPTNLAPINFTVEFSETVTGFTDTDIAIVSTAGAVTAAITGTGPTYNVAISGMTQDGTISVSIPAGSVTDLSNNFNAVSTSTDNTVSYLDANGPNVQLVNTNPETADHVLSNQETVTFDITQFKVTFNQEVYNPAGDSDAEDVTNPNNYMLIRDLGDTGGLQTVSCVAGAVVPADTQIAIGTVTYDNQTHTATFTVNGGLPLSNGDYHLFICGTTSIVDPLNNALALVGSSGLPGSDYRQSFTVSISGNGGGGGGGGNSSNAGSSRPAVATTGALIPVTGFSPNEVTMLPAQPEDMAYSSMDNITIEIPSLGIEFPIVGVSVTDNGWNLTWLKDNVGYLEDSAYPTFNGNTVLTAHVRDANMNLGPFSDIKGLKLGDRILLHAYGKVYIYEVQENTKISPNAISTAFKHEDYSWVTLITCEDYNAKIEEYYHRRMVRAVLISVVPDR